MAKNERIKRLDPDQLPEGQVYVDMGFRFRIYPTKEQEARIREAIHTCRFVWNHFAKRHEYDYRRHLEDPSWPKPMTTNERSRELTRMRNSHPRYSSFLKRTPAKAEHAELRHLAKAFDAFFADVKKPKGSRAGIGKPHPKRLPASGAGSFSMQVQYAQADRLSNLKEGDKRMPLPFLGPVKAKVHRDVRGRATMVTVTLDASGRFYATVRVLDAVYEQTPPKASDCVGVATGITDWLVTTSGERYRMPEDERLERHIRDLQRKLSKKKGSCKGEAKSANYRKLNARISKLKARQVARRKDATHKMTREIVNAHDTVCYRDMDVKGMLEDFDSAYMDGLPMRAKRAMHRKLADRNLFEVKRQLVYKSEWEGRPVELSPKDAPTAQVCTACGTRNAFVADERIQTWECMACGTVHDRKANGAENARRCATDVARDTKVYPVTRQTRSVA